eukprot:SAG22_NODE_2566_length_2434_cov_1.406852_5_plen_126_part_00
MRRAPRLPFIRTARRLTAALTLGAPHNACNACSPPPLGTKDFLEYFAGGDCDAAVNVAVGITGPYYHGRTLTATQAYPSYGTNGGCNHSAVRRCIPGGACGKPNVLLTGGKDVRRDVPDKTPLWE